MKRLITIACLLVTFTWTALIALGAGQEPRYDGKPMSYWVKCLRNKKYEVRTQGVRALGNSGVAAAEHVPALIELLADERSGVRQWKGDQVIFTVSSPEAEI